MSQISSSFPYAFARIKVLEQRLITKEKLSRLIEADSFDAAMKTLAELGYGQGISNNDFELLISKELDDTDSLIKALSPNDTFIQIMLTERDYQNLKSIIKLSLRNTSASGLKQGNISVERLSRAVSDKKYFDLPLPMKEALSYIDNQLAAAPDASIVAVALDRAYAKDIMRLVKRLGFALVTEYFQAFFDLTNIIALLRVRAASASKAYYDRAHLKGGKLSKRMLLDAFDIADDGFLAAAAKGYSHILFDAFAVYQKGGSLYMLEKARDDYLMSLLRENRFDLFGIGPLMGYYIAKQREAAAVRMVMSAKQSGIDTGIVMQRLKQLYQ